MTSENYEYHRPWVVKKLKELSVVFAIEVYVYAIMSSHYHVIFHLDADTVKNWNQTEVIKRWRKLSGGDVLLERYLAGQCKTNAQLDKVAETEEIFLPFRSQSI